MDTVFVIIQTNICYFCCTCICWGPNIPGDKPYLRRFILHLQAGVFATPDFGLKIMTGTIFNSFSIQWFCFLYMLLMVEVRIEQFFISPLLPAKTIFFHHIFFCLLTYPSKGQFLMSFKGKLSFCKFVVHQKLH